MKNNKILSFLLCAVVLIATACKDDFLQEKRDLSGVNEEVYQDPLLAQQYIDFVYGLFLPANNAQAPIWDLTTANGDFTKNTPELPGETNWNKPWASILYTNGHALSYYGTQLSTSIRNDVWTRVRQINLFLDNVDKYNTLDPALKERLKGQLYFWRGYQYFELVKQYGGVPLILTAQNPADKDQASLQVQRSSSSACIKQICADLDSAVAKLPATWGTSDFGRITSCAAQAMKGRVLLTWASPLFNRTQLTGTAIEKDASRWKDAYDANKKAYDMLVANGAGLAPNWANMWFAAGNTNPEVVMTYNFNTIQSGNTQKNNGWEQAVRSKMQKGAGSLSPTKEAVDMFPMKDGKMPGASKYTYSLQTFYKNRDPRFYNTFAYNGMAWPYNEDKNFRLWTYQYKQKDAKNAVTTVATETAGANTTGIYVSKGTNPSASNNGGISFQYSSSYSMPIRFAEVVLNLAESAAGMGNISEALDLTTQIRKRAGLESADNYGLGSPATKDAMIGAIIKERRIEFAFENKIYWDMRRWLLFDDSFGTASRLDIPVINGTKRTGYVISVLDGNGNEYVATKPSSGNAPDPLISTTAGALANRDLATATPSNPDDAVLDNLYAKFFKVSVGTNVDPNNPSSWKFSWYPEYYFFGLSQSSMNAAPFIEQTMGWGGLNGPGTFNPLL